MKNYNIEFKNRVLVMSEEEAVDILKQLLELLLETEDKKELSEIFRFEN